MKEGSAEITKTVRPLRQDVEVADIGCGFGGLLVALAPKLPNTLLLGMFPHNGSGLFEVNGYLQAWRFERKLQNTFKKESRL